MFDEVLSTKIIVPMVRKNAVPRDRLFKKIDAGIHRDAQIVLVSAPAGFGKTTLIASYIRHSSKSSAWITLADEDNDIKSFFLSLIKAVGNIHPEQGDSLLKLMEPVFVTSAEILMKALINELCSLPFQSILVLDDFQFLTNRHIITSVEYLLNHCPPNLFVVINSRHPLPFSVARLRAQNKIVEIGENDLRFTGSEGERFLIHTMGLHLSKQQIAVLEHKTESWAVGLQLAALSIKMLPERDLDIYISEFSGKESFLAEYFFSEVTRNLADDVKQFLYKVSVLDLLCAPLCDAIVQRTDSAKILQTLDSENLFLTALDQTHRWYRFHSLFTEYLLTQISVEKQLELHRAAAVWFLENGYRKDAILHYLAAKDYEPASTLISEQLIVSLSSYELANVVMWLDQLPDSVVFQNGLLCSYKAYALLLSSGVEKAKYYLDACLQSPTVDSLSSGRVAGIQSMIESEHRQAIFLAQKAVRLIGTQDPYARVFALSALAHAQRNIGDLEQSNSALNDALLTCKEAGFQLPAYSISFDLAFNYFIHGDLQQAIAFCKDMLQSDSSEHENPIAMGIMNIPLSVFYFEENAVSGAEKCALSGLEAAQQLGIDHIVGREAEMTLAKVRFVQGDAATAISILTQSYSEEISGGLPNTALRIGATLADIHLKLNHLSFVEEWAKANCLSATDEISSTTDLPYLVYTKLLIMQSHTSDAALLLEKIESFSRNNQRNGRLVTILTWKTILLLQQDAFSEARASINEAILLAEHQKYLRSFISEGDLIVPALSLARDVSPAFVERLIAAIHREARNASSLKSSVPPAMHYAELAACQFDKLSESELRILRLVSEGMSNTQISSATHIGIGTVKWHLYNIFSKLNVKNRVQAVNAAKKSGILV